MVGGRGVIVEPFDAVELDLGLLFDEPDEPSQPEP